MEEYKSVKEIMKTLNLPRSSIYYLIRKFNIKKKKVGLKKKLYDISQIKEIIGKHYANGK
jgi:predicted transcriptional regulator